MNRFGPRRALVLAVLAHAAVVGTVAVSPRRPTALVLAGGDAETAVEVAIEETAPVVGEPAPVVPVAPEPRVAVSAGVATRGNPGHGGSEVLAVEQGPEGERTGTTEGADAGAPSGFAFRPTRAVDLGLTSGAARYAPDSRARAEEGAVASQTGGLVESLDAKDVASGLGRGGPVRSAVESAARSGDAPVFGTATFSVAIRADGTVDVKLTDASRDHVGWQRLEPTIRAALATKPVRLPPKSAGLRVAVRVDASEQFPGGGRPTPDDKQGIAARAQFFKIKETKEHVEIELPYVAVGVRSRACGAGVTITPGGINAGAGCDVGTAMRVVATRIVSEERL